MTQVLALLADTAVITGAVYFTLRGKALCQRLATRHAERAVDRTRARTATMVSTGRRNRATDRALHNDFDFACRFWWGDRRPETNDSRNGDFGGGSAGMDARRCVICRPYTDTDEATLIGLPVLPEIGAPR